MDPSAEIVPPADAWRAERRKGLIGIVASVLVAAALWHAIRFNAPVLGGMEEPAARLVFALKCAAVAVLFTLFLAIEAIAHERLVSPRVFCSTRETYKTGMASRVLMPR